MMVIWYPKLWIFEVGSRVLGMNKRNKLPRVIGGGLAVPEPWFPANCFIASFHYGTTSQLDAVVQQLTQLQQQHIIIKLMQTLRSATSSHPQPQEEDGDMQSIDLGCYCVSFGICDTL
ncbi:hypothetical protein QQ045_001816 [Rhodiola kirilowii]